MPNLSSPPRVSRFGSLLPSIKVSPGRSSCPSCRIDATTCAGHPWYATAHLSKMLRLLALHPRTCGETASRPLAKARGR